MIHIVLTILVGAVGLVALALTLVGVKVENPSVVKASALVLAGCVLVFIALAAMSPGWT